MGYNSNEANAIRAFKWIKFDHDQQKNSRVNYELPGKIN